MSRDCSCHGTDGRGTGPLVGLLERPRYSPGLILEDSDLTSAVDYTRELNRLLFRSLFGCGVVCGLEVTVKDDCGLTVSVAPGLALDGCGDPIHLTGPAPIKLGERDGVLPVPGQRGPRKHRDFWVIACATEKQCAPRELLCDGDDMDGSRQNTRTRLGVEVSVSFEPPECICGCRKFDAKEKDEERDRRARELRRQYYSDENAEEESETYHCGEDRFGCHTRHYNDPDCGADCGCGAACSCGCCVLLAWVHWFDRRNEWIVLHKGVRRFVRPCLIDDPIDRLKPEDDDAEEPQDGEENDRDDHR